MGSDPETIVPADEYKPLHPARAPPSFLRTTSQNGELPPAIHGYVFMFVAAMSQATRAFLFHLAEVYFHIPASICLILSSSIFIILCTLTLHQFRMFYLLKLPPAQLAQLAGRGFFAASTIYLNNVALAHIPVGTALTLLSTVPAITSVIAAIFLKDPLSLVDVLVLFVNMFGVVLVARPTTLVDRPGELIGVLAGLGAAVSASIGFSLVKVMGVRVHFVLNTLSIGISGLFISLFVTSFEDLQTGWISGRGMMIALVGSGLGFVAQTFVNRGMQICRPGPALVVRTLNVPASFLLGLVFLGETVAPIGLLGVFLVLASVTYIGVNQMIRERTAFERRRSEKMASSAV